MSFIPAKKYSLSSGMKYGFFALGATLIAIALAFIYTTTISNQLTDPSQAAAVTLTVDSTLDTGDATPGDDLCDDGAGNCTLRAAIEEANGDTDTDSIHFNLPVTDPNHLCYADDGIANSVNPANEEVTTTQDACSSGSTIDPDHPYTWFRFSPVTDMNITEPTLLDAYTQSGAQANSVSGGGLTDAVLKIQIHGGAHGNNASGRMLGIIAGSTGSVVEGLVLTGDATRYHFRISDSGVTVSGNYVGTDPSGLIDGALHANSMGIYVLGTVGSPFTNITIGGSTPADRNIFSGHQQGIYFRRAVESSTFLGNYIGTDKTGNRPIANTSGILFYEGSDNNTVGGPTVDERNVISGNGTYGIIINFAGGSNDNHIMGNYLGIGSDGVTEVRSDQHINGAIYIVDDSDNTIIGTDSNGINDALEGNVISGNQAHGIVNGGDADNTIIAGNIIGLDASGAVAVPNNRAVSIGSASNVRVGTNGDGNADTEERNILSGSSYGVYLSGTDSSQVAGNYIGTDITGTIDLGNTAQGVAIVSGANNNIIGTDGDGVEDTQERNIISGNESYGIYVVNAGTDNNRISGNYIGTDVTGTIDIGNTNRGVYSASGPDGTVIGTDGDGSAGDADEGNVVSGNDAQGIVVTSSPNTVVAGNIVGLNAAGDAAIGNSTSGIYFTNSTSGIVGTDGDGTSDQEERNIVSGNGSNGIYLVSGANGVRVAGNYVGTDITGTRALGNTFVGIRVAAGSNGNFIGTNSDNSEDGVEGNVIAGNIDDGLEISNSSNNIVAGNFIGVDNTGNTALPNDHTGVLIQGGSTGNLIGTDANGTSDLEERNIVSGNNEQGIWVTNSGTDNNTVAGNYVGVGADGVTALGNTNYGIAVTDQALNNLIGSDVDSVNDTFEANSVLHNGVDGILVNSDAVNNAILSNIIMNNSGEGIELNVQGFGPDLNDWNDTDTGANDGLNHPIPLSISSTANPSIDIYLDVDTTDTTDFIVQLYDNPSGIDSSGHGEGEVYIDTQSITGVTPAPSTIADGTYTLNFTGTISDPANISLTITEDLGGGTYGSTSEFSAPTAQYIQGRVFTDTNYNSTDDGNAVDPGTNAVTYNVYHDTDSNGLIEPANDRLVYSGTTQDNVYAAEPGEYQAILSSAGDFLVEIDDTSTAISTSYIPTGPYQADTLPGSILNSSGSGPHTITFDQTLLASMGYGDPDGDVDGDGVTNSEEVAIGTSPDDNDSDDDGLLDGVEEHPSCSAVIDDLDAPFWDYGSGNGENASGTTTLGSVQLDVDFELGSGTKIFPVNGKHTSNSNLGTGGGSPGTLLLSAPESLVITFDNPVTTLIGLEHVSLDIEGWNFATPADRLFSAAQHHVISGDTRPTGFVGSDPAIAQFSESASYFQWNGISELTLNTVGPTTTTLGLNSIRILCDTDQDGTINPLDPDSDNDGLLDGTEDTNANGTVDEGETDPTNPDTDGDTLLDGDEDLNSNGSVDIGETDPRSADTDNDGDTDNVDICPLDPDNNCDGDNIPTEVENMGPNNGDSNNDGILDSLQASVASAPNQYAPAYQDNSTNPDNMAFTSMVLNTATSTCDTIDTLSFTNEASLSVQDDNYDYPLGLIDFEVSCTTNGDTADITYILDTQYDTEDWTWRKYQPHTQEYSDITDRVTFGTITIDDQTKTTATIQVTDGESLDDDETENGTILDPSGPAVLSEELSDTGTPAYSFVVMGAVVVMVGMVVKGLGRKRFYRV